MIFWIIFLIFNLQNCYMVAVMTMCLKKRFTNASVWKYILAFEVGTIVASYYRFALSVYSLERNIIYYGLQVFLILFLIIGFKDYAWKKILWYIAYVCVASLVEVICDYFLRTMFEIQIHGTWDCVDDLVYVAVTNLLLFTITIIPIMMWKKQQVSFGEKSKPILPLIIMPMSQCTMLNYLLEIHHLHRVGLPDAAIYLFGLCVIADVVFLLILIHQEEVDKIHRKIEELEHAWELEKTHYNELEEKERAISKARHDIKNQITVMYCLLEAGDVQKAKEMQDQLKNQI